jgi:hypothetical protein
MRRRGASKDPDNLRREQFDRMINERLARAAQAQAKGQGGEVVSVDKGQMEAYLRGEARELVSSDGRRVKLGGGL